MGLCESCCPRDNENSQQEEAYGDRSRLIESGIPGHESAENGHDATHNDEGRHINGTVPNGGDFLYGNSKVASVPKAPVDENQAALQEILATMSHDVMDAGMLEHSMEPADYQERAQEYGRRLNAAAHSLAAKYDNKKLDDLVEVPKDGTEGSGDLAETDAVLITEISSRAQDSIGGVDFQLRNIEDLVVHFGEGCHNASGLEELANPLKRVITTNAEVVDDDDNA